MNRRDVSRRSAVSRKGRTALLGERRNGRRARRPPHYGGRPTIGCAGDSARYMWPRGSAALREGHRRSPMQAPKSTRKEFGDSRLQEGPRKSFAATRGPAKEFRGYKRARERVSRLQRGARERVSRLQEGPRMRFAATRGWCGGSAKGTAVIDRRYRGDGGRRSAIGGQEGGGAGERGTATEFTTLRQAQGSPRKEFGASSGREDCD
jgi:hypothetical protein